MASPSFSFFSQNKHRSNIAPGIWRGKLAIDITEYVEWIYVASKHIQSLKIKKNTYIKFKIWVNIK